jgi:8-oxo-dGTP pyrophosphatase MutT (NUDIX family)
MTGKTQVERSAGGVLVRTGPRGTEFLVIRDRYGHWGLPKGHIEEGEQALAAARRECIEETGIEDLTAGPHLGRIQWRFRRRGRSIEKSCDFYLFTAPRDAEPQPQHAEGISQAVWLPAAEAVARIGYENTREIARRAAETVRQWPPDGAARG